MRSATSFKSRKLVGQSRLKVGPNDQILAIEKEIRETPYHKGTERHIGLLRARLAKLRDQEVTASSKGGGGGVGYAVKKQGDATIVLVGPPSVGKSTLLNKLTNAKSKVAPYAFTTVSVIPGMMKYKNAYIQILDVPGLIKGAEEGKGRGREVISVIRGADLLIIMTDPKNLDAFKSITAALERNGIRINKTSPDVDIIKKGQGGFIIHSNIRQDFDNSTVYDIAHEFGIKNGEITIREKLSLDRLVDAFAVSRVYIPAFFLINKAESFKASAEFANCSLISAKNDMGLTQLRERIWNLLQLATIFLLENSNEATDDNSMVVKKGITLSEVAGKIGSDFKTTKKGAKIWGPGSRFPGQEVSLSTLVVDGMQIRFV